MKTITIHFKNGDEITINATDVDLDELQVLSDKNIKNYSKIITPKHNVVRFRNRDILYLIERD